MATMGQQRAEQVSAGPGSSTALLLRGILARRLSPTGSGSSHAILAQLIERDVVPRLVDAGRGAAASAAASSTWGDPVAEIELVRLALSNDAVVCADYVHALRRGGMSYEAVCLDVLAPAARRLGEMWLQDVCDFADVTLGLGRLQHVLHVLSPDVPPMATAPKAVRRALFVAMPGEQHTFGVSMLVQFFRRSGWQAATAPVRSLAELQALVRRGRHDLVGLSVGSEERLQPVAGAVAGVRDAGGKRGVCVMVGGPIFCAHPELADQLGADTTAADAPAAVMAANALLGTEAALR